MKIIKTKYRTTLTDNHLECCLRNSMKKFSEGFMMWPTYFTCITIVICLTATSLNAGYLSKTNGQENVIQRNKVQGPRKRPFCNAFTGCGRKRSDISVPLTDNNESAIINDSENLDGLVLSDDTLSDLVDINSEPAVEDLTRQIMSQARMWEAIQEANREMSIMKHNNRFDAHKRFPFAFAVQ